MWALLESVCVCRARVSHTHTAGLGKLVGGRFSLAGQQSTKGGVMQLGWQREKTGGVSPQPSPPLPPTYDYEAPTRHNPIGLLIAAIQMLNRIIARGVMQH